MLKNDIIFFLFLPISESRLSSRLIEIKDIFFFITWHSVTWAKRSGARHITVQWVFNVVFQEKKIVRPAWNEWNFFEALLEIRSLRRKVTRNSFYSVSSDCLSDKFVPKSSPRKQKEINYCSIETHGEIFFN